MQDRTAPMKIKRFQIANFKRLSVVDITPQGDQVILAGENEQGKSSVLDAIEWILRGKVAQPEQAVHRGKKKARGVMCLSDLAGNPVLFIEREATTSGGASVKVRWADEDEDAARPQSLLDTFYSLVALEPQRLGDLAEREPKKFSEELRKLTGADTSKIDQQIAKCEAERLEAGREVKSAKARLDKAPMEWNPSKPAHPDAPAEEVSIHALVGERDTYLAVKRDNDGVREAWHRASSDHEVAKAQQEHALFQCDDLRRKLAAAEELYQAASRDVERLYDSRNVLGEKVKRLQDPDDLLAKVEQQLATAEETNRKVRENAYERKELARLDAERSKLVKEHETSQAKYDQHDQRIAKLREQRLAAIAAAKMPIPGLSFAEDGTVTYKDLPLDQASQAERYHVLTAICAAQNPQLRVIVLRNAALLGQKYRKLFAELARDMRCQLWEEHVDTSIPGAVILEDGRIAEKAPDTEPPPAPEAT